MSSPPVKIPAQIVKAVADGQCILFLGAMVSAEAPGDSEYRYQDSERPPGGAALSNDLANLCEYPDTDKDNLARVSLYYEYSHGLGREHLVREIRERVSGAHIQVSPALRMLAALPFRLCFTTNYDHLFERALRETEIKGGVKKDPIVIVYDPGRDGPPEPASLDPTEERPILFKLHGDIDKPRTIVVTEEDYITFIAKMASGVNHPIPLKLRARLSDWSILFIGYSLKDYNLRLLFKTIRMGLDGPLPLSFSVDPSANKVIVEIFGHGQQRLVDFLPVDLWDFVPALYRACREADYPPGRP